MTSARQFRIICTLTLLALFWVAPAFSKLDAGWITARLISIRPDSVQLRESNGTLLTASLAPSSILLRQGAPTLSLKSFQAGTAVMVRLRPAARDGENPRVEVLADSQTDSAMSAYGKKPLAGAVTNTMPGWLVIKTEDFPAVPVELTHSTLYRKEGKVEASCPFEIGDHVTVGGRISTTGTLLASTVSDQTESSAPLTELPYAPATTIKGSIFDIRPSAHSVIVLTGEKAEIAVSAPENITSIRVSRHKRTLADLQPGMKVTVHLTGASDSSGFVAKSISASP